MIFSISDDDAGVSTTYFKFRHLAAMAVAGRAVVDTRRYAKRQETWFRNRMADWRRFDPRNIREAAAAILKDPALPA